VERFEREGSGGYGGQTCLELAPQVLAFIPVSATVPCFGFMLDRNARPVHP
jgi:hypothetical protein